MEAQSPNVPPSPEVHGSNNRWHRQCPACQSVNVSTDALILSGSRAMLGSSIAPTSGSYPLQCVVCLDCGTLTHYLARYHLDKVNARLHATSPGERPIARAGCLGIVVLLASVGLGACLTA